MWAIHGSLFCHSPMAELAPVQSSFWLQCSPGPRRAMLVHAAAVPEYTTPLASGPFALPCSFLSRDLMYMWSSLFSCLHSRGCLSQASCLGHLPLMSASGWWFITKGWQEWIGRTVERQVFPQSSPLRCTLFSAGGSQVPFHFPQYSTDPCP